MNKYFIISITVLSITLFGWAYYITNQVTNYDTVIENCYQKIDSLGIRTKVLEALVEKQSEQNNKHEVTIYLKTK